MSGRNVDTRAGTTEVLVGEREVHYRTASDGLTVNRTVAVPAAGRDPSAHGPLGLLDADKLLASLEALRDGHFQTRLKGPAGGIGARIADTVNEVFAINQRLVRELEKTSVAVGKQGRTNRRASVDGASGGYAATVAAINSLIGDLLQPTVETARVIGAVAKGDLGQAMATEVGGRPLRGEFLRTAKVVNGMVDQLNGFASEVTRVAREVGTEGKLGGQAHVPGVGGTWKDLTDSVNYMASNLTAQVRNIAEVTTAVARGDLTRKITVDVQGEIRQLKDTINTMVDQLNGFASEVTRVAREVGTDGKLGGQAQVPWVGGTWKDLTDSVNYMASNLTTQVRNIAEVTTAVARGDLTRKITVDVQGEIRQLKDTINTMVDQLNGFASEVTRVAREVGTHGKLGGQAHVPGVGGTWKDLTDSVNSMASNLTAQVRNIADVTTAVANGDLTKKITVDVEGEIRQLKDTINTMVDRLNGFASEVTRVAREVGTDGKLGGQAYVPGVGGTWKDLTDSVNSMASNLTAQVRNIADVTTAVANGDLTKTITVDVEGEIRQLKDTINTMVDRLNGFASEVTRVAREVGTDGKLGGQAQVPGVGGTWKDLTDSVNSMASNLTAQVRNIAEVTTAVASGDLTKKITVDVRGEILQLKDTMNTMVDRLRTFSLEVTRVAREVGTDGKLGGQAVVLGVGGTWKDLTDSVNYMASNLTTQVRNIAEVTTAVARGDLTRKITVDVQGEIRQLKDTINTMVDQLNGFASEVTRVAREVGTDGKLGGQAHVPGVGGTWKDLTDSVNSMASNLTTQVRNIAMVVTAVASGDLKRKLVFEAKGEIAELAETINEMSDTLATFADQVTSVAREVGIEGKLGGQAEVPGASGIWRALTDNVNQLAGNLTSQVRALADVATAVTQGDLTRSITVEAAGEVAALKDNINQMIRNLSQTTRINTDQDWLKTNVAKFTRMMQGQRDMTALAGRLLSEVAPLVGAEVGVFYIAEPEAEGSRRRRSGPVLRRVAGFALGRGNGVSNVVRVGEGLAGQSAQDMIKLVRIAPAGYLRATSGLGSTDAAHVVAVPVLFEGQIKAVIELGAFAPFSEVNLAFLDQLAEGAGIMLNSIGATMQTEELLDQSQRLAEELQQRQNQLEQANYELGQRAELLAQQTTDLESSRQALHEKAEQVALTSKYKSEFLANMSHELRTPLNSLLILSRTLAENINENLTREQVVQSQTIHSAGTDLLELINDILDLSKIESGMMVINPGRVELRDIGTALQRSFRHVAEAKAVQFVLDIDPTMPALITDQLRLEQILKNLMSNAFKFTEKGTVMFSASIARTGFSVDTVRAEPGDDVIAFRVQDTGIGIAPDKQRIIFEAFQQEDGTTSRRHGGTGLGLSISRELARLLGAEIRLESATGKGSVFTLFLPARYVPIPPGTESPPVSAAALTPPVPLPEVSGVDSGAEWGAVSRPVDDLNEIKPGDAVALIIETDPDFAQILIDLARAQRFRAVVATRADEALSMVATVSPTAVTLDVDLPDRSGWSVLAALKKDPATRHIPVTVISGAQEDLRRGLRLGALACLRKPAAKEAIESALDRMCHLSGRVRTLLVIEADDIARDAVVELLAGADITTRVVGSGEAAMDCLLTSAVDCVVLGGWHLPDMTGRELLTRIALEPSLTDLPVVVSTGPGTSPEDRSELFGHANAIVVKDAASPEQLLLETAVILHRREATTAPHQRHSLAGAGGQDPVVIGRKVLVVDDDIRNIYVMTGLLERFGMNVVSAEDGRAAITMLQEISDVDVVLMDVMMPEMDGYETMRAIRAIEELRPLPILAVTANAMKGDRERCIEAGATDYISKPVEPEELLTLLHIWLIR